MHRDALVLRAAKPTLDDGLLFAHYLDTAAERLFRLILGARSENIIAKAFSEPNHDLSWQYVTFAQCADVAAGMVSGYSSEQHRSSSREPFFQAAGRMNLRMMMMLMLFAPLFKAIDTMADSDFYLQAIAVSARRRGEGIGAALLGHLEQRARESEAKRLCLDVSAENPAAIRFYKRHGLTVASQWPKRIRIPGIKLYRMVKTLQ